MPSFPPVYNYDAVFISFVACNTVQYITMILYSSLKRKFSCLPLTNDYKYIKTKLNPIQFHLPNYIYKIINLIKSVKTLNFRAIDDNNVLTPTNAPEKPSLHQNAAMR